MTTINAILWDLDGTLADTEALHYRSWRAALARHAIDYTYEQFLQGFGRPNGAILPGLLGPRATPDLVEAVSVEKEADFRRILRQDGVQMLAGVASWLEAFRRRGLRQAIASSGAMINIVATLEALDVGDHFDSVISGARLPQGKPDPAIFRLAAASLGVAPEHCLVIEDSLAGVEAARRAGMRCAAVGSVMRNPALHQRLEAIPGPPVLMVAELTELTWELLEQR